MKEKCLKRTKFLVLFMLCFVFLAQMIYQPGVAKAAKMEPSTTKTITIHIGK